jgi:hypothetical protein
MKFNGSSVRDMPLGVEIVMARVEVNPLLSWKVLLDVAAAPLKEYANASKVLDAALTTTTALVRSELYWMSAYPTRSR